MLDSSGARVKPTVQVDRTVFEMIVSRFARRLRVLKLFEITCVCDCEAPSQLYIRSQILPASNVVPI